MKVKLPQIVHWNTATAENVPSRVTSIIAVYRYPMITKPHSCIRIIAYPDLRI
ncbi:MAG: hypothetical protein LBH60_05590 [Prevotellaceae bacterium]|nr:hypothetical protein [Prevotellaceae bacterium]